MSTAQWQAQLARELKGADPASLRWTLPDGLVAEPFYHHEALAALGGPPAPCRRAPRPAATWWRWPCPLVPTAASR
ncbi:hypothetical protein GKZ68_06475 [Hymenobacter sp. BRD128]|uniref:hypothetical protein n=1 Tax=Hymenobacter sp. BRD128 TaxID=2675878 RepID=UPI0015645CE5|nr:hypothetical protein [Hymenobacter sp. BRD128]QKG56315.1 hypothetical protein GKZ68_06475 [Hymenobacter sp. BRD128]